MNRELPREEYHARIKWLIVSRALLFTFLLGTLIFFQQRYKIYTFPAASLYYFALSVYGLTGAYWYLLRRPINLPGFAHFQIYGDILLVTVLVHITGGIDSAFSLLYHLIIISASIILYRRGGYLSASFSSILYGALVDMQYYNALGLTRSQNFTAIQVLYQVFVTILSFYIMAFLSGYLSERLRRTRQELRKKSIDFDDLRVLQDHILRSVGSGIITMDMTGKITSWNPAAEKITGYRYEDIRERWQQVFGECIKGLFGHTDDLKERAFHFEGRILKQDGDQAILGFTASLLKDDHDSVRGIILTFQDITRMVEMEEQIRRQERLATVGSLAAGIAHEIRNPLASLSGSIQMLQGELNLKDDQKHLMEIVLRETGRLNTIITEFLEYARPRTSQRERISLFSLVQETVTLFRNSSDFREDIRITCGIDPALEVSGDPQRLRQVFWNLLINAAQAIPGAGRIGITADLEPGRKTDREPVTISISDTGTGISPQHLAKIFDPFFTTKTAGTGLGLAIVYRIIEDHGGTIDVRSEAGKGATFRIRFPVQEAPALASMGHSHTG